MAENKGFDILDYLVLLVKWKKILFAVLAITLVLSYAGIYFGVGEEFESSALIIPYVDNQTSNISGLMKNLKDLPAGLGGGSKSNDTDLYLTVIFSRTTLENLLDKFNLMRDYKLKSRELALKVLSKKISAAVTNENAFQISVRANSGKKASEMVNYLVSYLDGTIKKFDLSKSRNNREFLDKRYAEAKENLKRSEDSLQIYQEKSGMFETKEQAKLMLGTFSQLETDVAAKKIELSAVKGIYSEDAPQVVLLRKQLSGYENELAKLKGTKNNDGSTLSINALPGKAKNYVRLYREVEINSKIMEVLVPIYEQAKFDEQKNLPVLQVIDYGQIPEKRVFPQRALFSLIISFVITGLTYLLMVINVLLNKSTNPKVIYIRQGLSPFKRKSNERSI